MTLKRHFYNKKDYLLDEKEQIVVLHEDFHQKLLQKKLWNKFGFKKIGGSTIGEVLESDKFKSQFAAFCKISWLGLPILDTKYIDAGKAIEPIVIKKMEQKLNTKIATFDVTKYNYDLFPDEDVVGGIPDGLIEKSNDQFIEQFKILKDWKKVVLEVKTTGEKNLENWKTFGIPEGYKKQAQLYAFLMNAKYYAIIATFLKEKDYINPEKYPINNRKTKMFLFKLNKDKVLDDVNKIKKWYVEYTVLGKSPKYDLEKDQDLVEYLRCSNKKEWEQLQEKWKAEGKIPDKDNKENAG